jgi:hypothetical protein
MSDSPMNDPLGHLVEVPRPGAPELSPEDRTKFVDDRWFAEQIGMKVATIRSQRFRRRQGLPHWLTIDAVMIGSCPRYRRFDALEWLASR